MSEINMSDNVNPDPSNQTMCTGDCSNNVWFQNGSCKLDQLTYEQVHYTLQHNAQAKKDLVRVTSDETLLRLASQTELLMTEHQESELLMRRINNPERSLPFYTVYRGNM